MNKKMTFAMAMRDFFGGTSAAAFMRELKALSDKDKEDFKGMLNEAGYEIVAST